MRRVKNIHFVGIGGAGMSGIAEVLLNQGYHITGSDQNENSATSRLKSLGAKVFIGHASNQIADANVVVISSAIAENNPEVQAARIAHIPVVPRAQMLAELMRFHNGIAIAGTHGKTTTTSLIASILAEGGLDPTFVIGGLLNGVGTHARLGQSQYFVVEADESDASFLFFNPTISVVTNIDADHMQTYDNDFNKLKKAFVDFLQRLPFYGLAVICVDNPIMREIMPQISRPTITYGFEPTADIQAFDFTQKGFTCHFKVHRKTSDSTLEVKLNLAGKHNVTNALAAIAVATECGVSDAAILHALAHFKGVGRRMQHYGPVTFPGGKVAIIDDYGHHPQEVAVTIAAVRAAWPKKRLVLAFQPHRYSRTQNLFEDFTSVLSEADALLLMEIYAASEQPIPGIDSKALARNIRQRGKIEPIYVENNKTLIEILPKVLHDDDVLLIQGAGNIGAVAPMLAQQLLIETTPSFSLRRLLNKASRFLRHDRAL